MSQYLGDISAYALAVSQGYTGTEEEYAELMASYATVGQTAVTAAQTATTKASEAATSATTATNKATEATTAATTATNKAAEAQADADAAALDASQAMSAASTATTKATEATTAAATAVSAKDDAVSANTAAQSAKTAAQTAQTGAETAAASVQSSAAQIQTNADDISELKEDLVQPLAYSFANYPFKNRIKLYPCQFLGETTRNVNGGVSDATDQIVTVVPLMFSDIGGVHFYSTDSNITFRLLDSANRTWVSPWSSDFYFDGSKDIEVLIKKGDGTAVVPSDLDSVHLECNGIVYQKYVEDNMIELTGTGRFPNYNAPDTYITRYGIFKDTQLGFCKRLQTNYRVSYKPIYCKKPVTIYCGTNDGNNAINVVYNATLYTITSGEKVTVPADTVFEINFETSYSDIGNNIVPNGACFSIPDSTPSESFSIAFTKKTVSRADAGVLLGNKVFAVSSDIYEKYSVFDIETGEYVVTDATMPHTAGHANSANYNDGYIYVSDWTDNNLIHVFTADMSDDSISYEKDIELPTNNFSGAEFFVQNTEKEIFFVGKDADYNIFHYGLYIYDGTQYILSYSKAFISSDTYIQGFTKVGDYLYIVFCNSSYQTSKISKLNIPTGEVVETTFTTSTAGGGYLARTEGEQIIHIEGGLFLIICYNGNLCLCTI